jgi:hypothetical protein
MATRIRTRRPAMIYKILQKINRIEQHNRYNTWGQAKLLQKGEQFPLH